MGERWSLLSEVFNARGLLLAFFGALGGGVRWAIDRSGWKAGLRKVFIGTATAFGVGLMAPTQLEPWVGAIPEDAAASIGTLCGTAFLVGFVAQMVLERIMGAAKGEPSKGSGPPM